MRTIHRDIVGAFIFSSDGKILLGYIRKGGVYQGQLVVPGGGIEEGETKIEAMRREVLEEVGIDTIDAKTRLLDGFESGESEKTLRDSGEQVLVKMKFYDFVVNLKQDSGEVVLRFEDDFESASWYTPAELKDKVVGELTKKVLEKLNFLQ